MKNGHPIIIIGPPRSGTTLMSKILSISGVFMGFNQNKAWEDWFFVSVNEHLLDELDIYWDRPERPNPSYQPPIQQAVEHIKKSDSWQKTDIPWGFKDPRTTLVVDVWEKIFKELGVVPTWIRMRRHPMDIAHSLYVREQKKVEANPKLLQQKEAVDRGVLNGRVTPHPRVSRRCLTLEGALKVAREMLDLFPQKGLDIAFEELVTSPADVLPEVSEHIGMQLSDRQIETIFDLLNSDRAYSFKEDDELVRFWEKNSQ